MHLEDFPMDAHACPLKFGSCKSNLTTARTHCQEKSLPVCGSRPSVKQLWLNLCDLVFHSANAKDMGNNEVSWMTKALMETELHEQVVTFVKEDPTE